MKIEDVEFNSPVLCADGELGMVTKIWHKSGNVLVQVPGEELERHIKAGDLEDEGNGSLREVGTVSGSRFWAGMSRIIESDRR